MGKHRTNLLGRGVLGDGLGAFGHGVLGELSGEDEADSGLDLAGRQGGLLVVAAQATGLGGDLLEDVVDEGVHDAHGAARDAGVRVNLLQDLEDVGGVGLGTSLFAAFAGSLGLPAGGGCGLCLATRLSFSSFSGHLVVDLVGNLEKIAGAGFYEGIYITVLRAPVLFLELKNEGIFYFA